MHYFLKAILLSFRHKWTILLSIFNALLIALFWGISISSVYPFVEVVFEGKTVGAWVDEGIAQAETESDRLRVEIAALQKEMEVRGKKVWLIKSVPRSKEIIEETGYTQALVFVRQDNYVVVRTVNWVNKSKKLKYMDIPKLELIDGIWTPLEISMTTKLGKKTDHKTILKFENIKYNQQLDENLFTTRRLEQGL